MSGKTCDRDDVVTQLGTFPGACYGVTCGEILLSIKTGEDVRQFWRGYRLVAAACVIFLILELIAVFLIRDWTG